MREPITPTIVLACALGGVALEPPARRSADVDVRSLLREVGFTDGDWAAIERGGAVARILDTDAREIAVAGSVRIAALRERLVARIREIENLERSAVVLDAGRFSDPPRAADLSAAPFEEYNLDLRDCRAGDCRVRLGADDIARFHRDIDWRHADWRERSAALWRELLAGYARGYVRDGAASLPIYANKTEPLSVAGELKLLGARFAFVRRYSPAFHDYLQHFNPAGRAGAEETMYWTKEDFGVRPVFRLSHQVIYPASAPTPAVLIATSQVYADHYLDAALGVTLAIDSGQNTQRPGFYMVAVNRARTRSLSGVLRRMVRGTVQGRSREAMRKILISTKSALESSSAR